MTKEQLLKEYYKNCDINVKGLENIPNKGTNMYISNHICMNDIFLLKYILKNAISIVSSNSLFKEGERKELYHKLLTPFPLEVRGGKNYTDVCMRKITDLLINHKNIIIFPEGVFSDNDKLLKAKTGAIRILFDAKEINKDINIIPICIDIDNLNDERKHLNAPWDNFKANITILEPFKYDDYYKEYLNSKNIDIIRKLIDDIMTEIANTKSVIYTNEYGKLYDTEGFYFPNGELIKFEDSTNEKYYIEYAKEIDNIYNSVINEKDI